MMSERCGVYGKENNENTGENTAFVGGFEE